MRNRIIFLAITILILIPGIGMSQEINWVKYPDHIDLGTENQVSHPSVVFDGNKYHLWYVSQSGAQRSINYAKSADGITWEVYPGNPVLQDGIGEVWDGEWVSQPSVVYDGTTFQMWYCGYDGNTLRIGYATSPDGVNWNKYAGNPVLDAGISGAFDNAGVSSPSVLYDGTVYRMWYSGYDGTNMRIGYATSTDGAVWNKSISNPVLDPGTNGDWDDAGVSSPSVLHDGDMYRMWYTGYDGANMRIGYAVSTDGLAWNKDTSNPVLDLGPGGSFDDEGVSSLGVLYDGTVYRMWYSGYDESNMKIGYALGLVPSPTHISPQMNWVKYPAHIDLETEGQVSHPSVVFDGSKYHLWYVSNNQNINYARSTDGITWEAYPGNPVLKAGAGDAWDGEWVSQPSVVYDGTTFQMWYAGYDGDTLRIGYATSTDGVSWNKDASNPVIGVGASGSFDEKGVSSPGVLYEGTTFRIWYSGYDGANLRIGYATSSDGVSWDKDTSNPVLDLGPGGDFDDAGVSSPSVLYDGTQYHIFYSGYDGTNMRIGYAASPDGVSWNKDDENPVLDLGPCGAFDNAGVSSPDLLYDGTLYRMFYSGYDGSDMKIGYAVGQGVPGLAANAGSDVSVCSGTCAVLNGSVSGGSGSYSYSWTPANGLSNPNIADPEACPDTTTAYTLTVTDLNNCTVADQVVVTVRECDTAACSVVANAGSDVNICSGTCAVLNGSASGGSGTYSYSWTPTTGLSNPNIRNPEACPDTTTAYTLTVTDDNGCTTADQVVVTVRECDTAACSVTANAGSDVSVCSGTCAVLNGSASGGSSPYSYSWTPTVGLSNPNIRNPEACPDATTAYTLTVTDLNNCTAADQVVVTVRECDTAACSVVANAGSDVNICSGTCAVLNGSASGGSGTYSYSWTPANGLSNPNIANPQACPDTTTAYTLTVTDLNNCTAADQVVVTVRECDTAACSVTANAGSDVSVCSGTCAALNGSASGGSSPYSYSWTPTVGLSNPNIRNPEACPDTTTAYTLTVTDLNNCTAADQVVVTVTRCDTAACSVVANAGSDVSVCSGTCAALNGSASGGSGTYSYSWTPTTDLSNPNIADPGACPDRTTAYTLTVTDDNGCTAADQVVVTVTRCDTAACSVVANAGSDVNICSGTCAALNGSVSGGSGTYSYSWTPTTGLSNPNIANPEACSDTTTAYTLTVTDNNGCTDDGQVVVTVYTCPAATISITPQDLNMYVDEAADYLVIATDSHGNSWDVTDGTIFATTGGGTFTDNRFKAEAVGTFVITATYLDLTTTTTVKIKSHGEAVGLSLHLSPDTITADGAVTCTVYGTDTNGVSWNITSEVATFSTQDPKGTFANNIYCPGQVGEWVITAEIGTLRATATVSVSHGAAVFLEIAPDSVSLTADDQQEYRGTARDNDGNQWDGTEEIAWSEDDPIGIMAANVYYPGQAGNWTIIATYTTIIDTATVKVISGAFVDLTITAPTAITTQTTFTLTVSLYDSHKNPYSGEVAMTNTTKSITPDKITLSSGTWTGQAVITQSPVGGVDTITVSHNSVQAAAAMTVFLNSELGGTVANEGATIEFDPGDLGTTNVTVHIDTSTLLPEPLPGAIRFAGIVYNIELIDGQGNKIGTRTGQIGPVVVYLSYPDANNDGRVDGTWIKEENLVIYQFENGTWIPLPTNINPTENVAWADVQHFCIFALGGIETIPCADGLGSVNVYPNPYVPYDNDPDNGREESKITFEGLSDNVKIRIFKLSGDLVREEELSGQPSWQWDATNQSGKEVGSGYYIYLITNDKDQKATGKIAIVR